MTAAEIQAITTDAQQRLAELQAVRDVLLPDHDDPAVLSELVSIESAIRSAERAIRLNSDQDIDR